MFVSLTIVRYPKIFIPFAFFSMAIFRFPLFFNNKIKFWKLLGCGKNGTFDIYPDFQQWGLLCVWERREDFEDFEKKSWIQKYWRLFSNEKWTLLCKTYETHGAWDAKQPFGIAAIDKTYDGMICILTRASIRTKSLKSFWENVPKVAKTMASAEGFITSIGIGEVPFVRQATFSVWRSINDVKEFAYRQGEHAEVIKKTRREDWYSEELFARFIPLESTGTIFGRNPLND